MAGPLLPSITDATYLLAAVIRSPAGAGKLDSLNVILRCNEVKTQDLISAQQFGDQHRQIRLIFTFRARQTCPRVRAFVNPGFDRGLVISMHGSPRLLCPLRLCRLLAAGMRTAVD